MKLFYKKHIFFTNLRKGSNKKSCGRHNSLKLRNYMKNKVKELGLKKIRINSFNYLNRCKLGSNLVAYLEGYWYKISNKEDFNLLIGELLIKNKYLIKT